ncbi:MAG: hypothetical protein WBM41_13370 [Arenicellales bacterium]
MKHNNGIEARSSKRARRPKPPGGLAAVHANRYVRFGVRFQSIDATHALKRSAGVSWSNVFLGIATLH